MNSQDVVDLCREALVQAAILSAPLLGAAVLVGLIVAVVQTLTQVQDQAVSTVPRLLAVLLALAVCLPWMLDRLVDYSHSLFQYLPVAAGG